MLPDDWRAEIESCWAGYASSSRVYALREGDEVIGGGSEAARPVDRLDQIAEHFGVQAI